jgi:hypothetical protein
MRVRRRIKRTTRQYIIVALICIVVIGGAAVITSVILTSQIREEYNQQLSEVYKEKVMNQRNVYVAAGDIMKGDLITADNVKKMTVYSSQPEETYVGEDGMGKAALLDIPEGTHLQNNMLTEMAVTSELREVEYDVINVNTDLINNDTVDIRIFFPNGEDYIILTKKEIKGITADTGSCFLWLTEEEILRMASATVDAYLYNGAKIYTTKYIEPNLQVSSRVTYEPSVSTQLLIRDNPNILETATNELSKQVRKAMENRLAASLTTNVEEIEWELSPNSISEDSIPEVLKPEENVTYKDESTDKDGELDYGP